VLVLPWNMARVAFASKKEGREEYIVDSSFWNE
jgi:hypothetical protein